MKVKILVGISAALFLLISVPAINGLYYKHQYNKYISLPSLQASNTKFVITKYKPGILQSSIESDLRDKHNVVIIHLKQIINHGPIIYDDQTGKIRIGFARVNTQIYADNKIQRFLLNQNASEAILSATSFILYDGKWSTKIKAPEFDVNIPNILTFKWQGMNGRLSLQFENDALNNIFSDLSIGSISANSSYSQDLPSIQLTTLPIRFQQQASLNMHGIWLGSTRIHINYLNIVKNREPFLSLIDFHNTTELNIGPISSYYWQNTLSVKQLHYPGFLVPSINDSNIALRVNHIDAATLTKLFTSPAIADILLAPAQSNFKIGALDAINKESKLSGESEINTSLGKMSAKINAFLPKESGLPSNFTDLKNNISIQLSVEIDKALGDFVFNKLLKDISATNISSQPELTDRSPEANKILSDLQQQGLVIENQNTYIINVLYQNGQMTINGKNPSLASTRKNLTPLS